MKRTLSIVLSILMVLSCCAALFITAGAEETQYPIKTFAGYAGGDVSILVRQGEKITIADITGKDYNYYRIIVADKDGKIVEVNEKLGRAEVVHSEEDGRKDLVEIPDGGFIIGVHNDAIVADGSVYASLFGESGVKVGQYVVLNGVKLADLAELAAGTALEGASFSISDEAPAVEPTDGIVADGKLTDWDDEGWTKVVPGENGGWQGSNYAPMEGSKELAYSYQYAVDEDNFYIAVKTNYELTKGNGNGASSFFRIWLKADLAETTTAYTHFFETYVKADDTLGYRAAFNTNKTGNTPINADGTEQEKNGVKYQLPASQYTYCMAAAEEGFVAEMVIPLSEINTGADGKPLQEELEKFYLYITVSTEKGNAGEGGSSDQCLFSPALGVVDGAVKHITQFWNAENNNKGHEILVKEPEPVKVGKYPVKTFAGYAGGDVSVLVRQGEKITIADITGKDYNYYRTISVDKDGFIVDINEKLGRAEVVHSEEDGRKDLVEIPEGGFIIGIHDNAITEADSVYADLFGENGVKIGDGVELYGKTLEELAALEAGTVLENVSFDTIAYEEVPEGAIAIDYFGFFKGDICNILTPLASGENTVGGITAVTYGGAQDYTWWNAIIVDSDGFVTTNIGMVDKTEYVIPEGGFMLLGHGGSPAREIIATIPVGYIVNLYNVDLAALAEGKTALQLKKAAFTFMSDPSIVHPISFQKPYTTTNNTRTDSFADDGVKLTDGVISDNGGTAASSGLVGDACTITVNLEDAYLVDRFTLHSFGGQWGITNIDGFTVEYSLDGENFTAIDAASVAGEAVGSWQATTFTIEIETPVFAQYVRFTSVGGNYCWADEVEVWEAEDAEIIDIPVSHHNAYNWSTFDAMIVTLESVKKVPHVSNGVDESKFIMYVVANRDGHYVAVKYVNDASMNSIAPPEGGFLLFACPANRAYEAIKDGAILGCELLLRDFDLSATFAIDSTANPDAAHKMIAIPYSAAVELPDGIWGQDATVEDPTIYGDLNGNGKVDAVDYAKVKRAVIGTYKLTEEEAFLADVDHDGQIKAKDYAMIKRIVLKTYTPDPIYFVISARMELHADGTGRYSVAFGDVLSMDVELEFVSYDAETGVYTYSLILEGEVVGEGEISVNEDGSLTLYDEAGDTILPVYDPDEEPKPVPVTEPVPSVG